MKKMLKNEKGFGAIEILLTLIFLAIVVFIGVYVAHNRDTKKASSTTTNSTIKPSATSLTLAQAASQVNYVYAQYETEVLDGQVLQDKSQWATSYVSAAEDLQFINNNKAWFTSAFIARVNNYESTNTMPPGGGFMMCVNGSVYFNNGSFVANMVKANGTKASLNLTYTTGDGSQEHGPKTNHSLPVTVKVSNANTWAIDSIDLSSCPSS